MHPSIHFAFCFKGSQCNHQFVNRLATHGSTSVDFIQQTLPNHLTCHSWHVTNWSKRKQCPQSLKSVWWLVLATILSKSYANRKLLTYTSISVSYLKSCPVPFQQHRSILKLWLERPEGGGYCIAALLTVPLSLWIWTSLSLVLLYQFKWKVGEGLKPPVSCP